MFESIFDWVKCINLAIKYNSVDGCSQFHLRCGDITRINWKTLRLTASVECCADELAWVKLFCSVGRLAVRRSVRRIQWRRTIWYFAASTPLNFHVLSRNTLATSSSAYVGQLYDIKLRLQSLMSIKMYSYLQISYGFFFWQFLCFHGDHGLSI